MIFFILVPIFILKVSTRLSQNVVESERRRLAPPALALNDVLLSQLNSHFIDLASPISTDMIVLFYRLLRAIANWISFSKDCSIQHLTEVPVAEVKQNRKKDIMTNIRKYGFTAINNKP